MTIPNNIQGDRPASVFSSLSSPALFSPAQESAAAQANNVRDRLLPSQPVSAPSASNLSATTGRLDNPLTALSANVAFQQAHGSALSGQVNAQQPPAREIEMSVFSSPQPAINLAATPSAQPEAPSDLAANVRRQPEQTLGVSAFVPSQPGASNTVPRLSVGTRRPELGDSLIAERVDDALIATKMTPTGGTIALPPAGPSALVATHMGKAAPPPAASDDRIPHLRLGSRGESHSEPIKDPKNRERYVAAKALTENIVAEALFKANPGGPINPSDPNLRTKLELSIELQDQFLTFWGGRFETVTLPDGTTQQVKKFERMQLLEFFQRARISPDKIAQFCDCIEDYRAIVAVAGYPMTWRSKVGEAPDYDSNDDQNHYLIANSQNLSVLPRANATAFATSPITYPKPSMFGSAPTGPIALDTLYAVAKSAGISKNDVNNRVARAEATYAQALKKAKEKMDKCQKDLEKIDPKDKNKARIKERKKLEKRLADLKKFHNFLQEMDRFQLYWAAVFADDKGYNNLKRAKELKAALEDALHDQAIAAGVLSPGVKDPSLVDYAAMVGATLVHKNVYFRYCQEIGMAPLTPSSAAFMIHVMHIKPGQEIDFANYRLPHSKTMRTILASARKKGLEVQGKCKAKKRETMASFIASQPLLATPEKTRTERFWAWVGR